MIARPFLLSIFIVICAGSKSISAVAQDWETVVNPAKKSTMAYVQFDNGIAVASRCENNVFEVIVTGLPDSDRDALSRTLRVSIGDEPLATETWSVGTSRSTAFSRLPAPFARRMAAGGTLQISVPGTAGRPGTRYVMELSPSTEALQNTLTACGRNLTEARDALMTRNAVDGLAALEETSSPIEWLERPRAEYPTDRARGYAPEGSVTLTCIVQDNGRPANCVVESEHPPGFNFAREAIAGASRARLGRPGDPTLPIGGRMIVYTTNFKLQ